MRIFRWQLDITDHHILWLPLSSVPLSVAPGRRTPAVIGWNEYIDLWALVPEEAPNVEYHIHIIGTGNLMPEALSRHRNDAVAEMLLGTVVMQSGMVWHVFWENRPRP